MANFVTSVAVASVAKAGVGASTTAQTNAPVSNVVDYTRPYRVFRATDCVSGTTRIYLDFGVATSIASVAVFNLNITSLKVQSSSDASAWSDATVNGSSSALTVSQDGLDRQYKFYGALTSFNSRYLGLLAQTSTTTDGTSSFQCGAIAAFTSVTTWTHNTGYPFGRTPMRSVFGTDQFDGGGRETVVAGNPYAQLSLTGRMKSTMQSTIDTVLASYGQHTPFLFYRNNGDTSEVYILRRVGQASWQQAGPNHHELSSLLLESPA